MGVAKYLKDLSKRLHKTEQDLSNKILLALDSTGQQIVSLARATKTYQDRTGNLTASIGYGVYHGGEEYSIGGFGSGVGGQKGLEKLAQKAALHKHKPYVLVVVAGMDYAIYVERSGYVVLDAAGLRLDSVVYEELNKVKVYGL